MSRRASIVEATTLARRLSSEERFVSAKRLLVQSEANARRLGVVLLRLLDPEREAQWARAAKLARELLYDADDLVCREAAVTLACLAEDTSTAVSALRHDDRPGVRLASALGVGRPRTSSELAALVELVRDTDVEVRRWAAFFLADAPSLGAEGEEALLHALEDDDREVRGEALVGLARAGICALRVREVLVASLTVDAYDDWTLEAAGLLRDDSVRRALDALERALAEAGLVDELENVRVARQA
ncbi:MAG: hypothetical protein H6721_15095 [Sandaracinus sp.]|nr:hypothetical protein [Sandaracinus sp.]